MPNRKIGLPSTPEADFVDSGREIAQFIVLPNNSRRVEFLAFESVSVFIISEKRERFHNFLRTIFTVSWTFRNSYTSSREKKRCVSVLFISQICAIFVAQIGYPYDLGRV